MKTIVKEETKFLMTKNFNIEYDDNKDRYYIVKKDNTHLTSSNYKITGKKAKRLIKLYDEDRKKYHNECDKIVKNKN